MDKPILGCEAIFSLNGLQMVWALQYSLSRGKAPCILISRDMLTRVDTYREGGTHVPAETLVSSAESKD